MEKLLVSACLLGVCCKYSGGSNRLPDAALAALRKRYALVPVCPETAGGLPVPREPSERVGAAVRACGGADVTPQFRKGAEVAVALARRFGCRKALLKANSPSCGSGRIYDGSFTGTLVPGDGMAAGQLRALGVELFSETELEEIM